MTDHPTRAARLLARLALNREHRERIEGTRDLANVNYSTMRRREELLDTPCACGEPLRKHDKRPPHRCNRYDRARLQETRDFEAARCPCPGFSRPELIAELAEVDPSAVRIGFVPSAVESTPGVDVLADSLVWDGLTSEADGDVAPMRDLRFETTPDGVLRIEPPPCRSYWTVPASAPAHDPFGPVADHFLDALKAVNQEERAREAVWHHSPGMPFTAACGADEPNQRTTPITDMVTCGDCRRLAHLASDPHYRIHTGAGPCPLCTGTTLHRLGCVHVVAQREMDERVATRSYLGTTPEINPCVTTDATLDKRKGMEARVEAALACCPTEEAEALLYDVLRKKGWDSDRARLVLRKAGLEL